MKSGILGHHRMTEFVVILGFLYVYFFPTFLAYILRHVNPRAIFFTNFMIGWTVVGWILVLVWVFDTKKPG
ncbi:superinfection immunity protein [Candidatus Kaiserbacteria bacterium CG10_big_fil_rev_8_21_14_0_10_59_10]|uniref:Superinfection immunity protein n=1 Tax=Candidatus Kaiserbacteria bacterium CG10_big_fil_rev_8_21_14_0_10_59_10 TaxID=1974612 RepID=A0A2H0U6Z4_9BACT|nr:MAG: superinfection immunity protein [Candidatus Kaiserbacteria bacterium CG10_big_fil_rev_8_21_14_0_10_59_10]